MSIINRFLMLVFAIILIASIPVGAEPSKEEIAQAIKALSHEDWETRENAETFLWESGLIAKPALENALKNEDNEVVKRASKILGKFDAKIFKDTSKDIAALYDIFIEGDKANKIEAVKALVDMEAKAVPTIISLCKRTKQTDLWQPIIAIVGQNAHHMATHLFWENKLDEAENILELGIESSYDNCFRTYALLMMHMNKTEEKARQLTAKFEKEKDKLAGKTLVYLFRAIGDIEKAEEYARKLDDNKLLAGIIYEKGDWKNLQSIVLKMKEQEKEPTETVNYLNLIASLYVLNGEKEKYAQTEKAIKNTETSPFDRTLPAIHASIIANNDPAKGIQMLDESYLHVTVALLAAQKKYNEIKTIYEEVKNKNIVGDDGRDAYARIASTLYNIGMKKEANELFEKVLAAPKNDRGRKFAVIRGEVEKHPLINATLKCGNQAMTHFVVANKLNGTQGHEDLVNLFSTAFPGKGLQARILWEFFEEKYPAESKEMRLEKVYALIEKGKTYNNFEKLVKVIFNYALNETESEDACLAVIKTCLDAGKKQLALDFGEQAISQIKTSSINIQLGDIFMKEKQWAKAGEKYAAAITIDKENPLPRYLRGYCLYKSGEIDKGNELMRLASLMPSTYVDYRIRLAQELTARGLIEHAKKEYRTSLRTESFYDWDDLVTRIFWKPSPTGEMLYPKMNNALILSFENKFGEAADEYQRLMHYMVSYIYTVPPEYVLEASYNTHMCRARHLLSQGKVAEAINEADICLKYLPSDPAVVKALVPELEKMGKKDEADKLFAKVQKRLENIVKEYPQEATVNTELALLYSVHDLEKAQTFAEKAVALLPNDDYCISTLAEIHHMRGNKEKAIELINKCIRKFPSVMLYHLSLEKYMN